MKAKEIIREGVSTSLGLGIFLVLGTSSIPIILSGVAGIGMYFGMRFLLTSDNPIKFLNLSTDVVNNIEEITLILDLIKSKDKEIKDKSIANKLKEISDLGKQITNVLIKSDNPHPQLNEISKILNSVVLIINKYLFLS